jgi:hypothetical protein
MSKIAKILAKVLQGDSDANIAFRDLRSLLQNLGFEERIRGDHHIFTRDNVVEIVNLQPIAGKSKPYQVKQVRAIITSYRLATPVNVEPTPERSSNIPESPPEPEGHDGE